LLKLNIAIDGPAGAGKSTIAKIVSQELGILYIDTGAMYRTVAYKALKEGISFSESQEIAKLVQTIEISLSHINGEQKISLDGEDVTNLIRLPEVSMGASDVAAVTEVRVKMVELQRKIAEENSVVMDGRDIGTFVLPNANLKIYLTATVEERAQRRYIEMVSKGITDSTLKEVMNDIQNRDFKDMNRAIAPLKKADDALELDTTGLSVTEVAKKIISLVRDLK
jgi:cytidylate kinase